MNAQTSSASRWLHGRYYAGVVYVSAGVDPQETIQEMLDASTNREWHLAGVAGGLPEGVVVLFGTPGVPASQDPRGDRIREVGFHRNPTFELWPSDCW